MVHQLSTEVLDELSATALLRATVEGLVAALKASRTEIQTLKTQMDRKITTLQAQLQPVAPSKVRAQRVALVTEAADIITGQLTQGTQLFELEIGRAHV